MSTSVSQKFADAILFVVSVFVLFGAFAFFQWRSQPAATKTSTGKGFRFPVRVEPASRGEMNEVIVISGDLLARYSTTLHSELNGVIARVGFREGATVRKGETVLQLQRLDQRLVLQKQQALLLQAKASAVRARAILARDRDQFKRVEQLRRSQTVAENEWIQARYQYEASKATHTESEATVALRNAELGIAERDLVRTTIQAPFDGQISRLYVERGKRVRDGDPLLDLVDHKGLEVRLYIPPRYISRVHPGQAVSFGASSLKQQVITQIVRLLPIADANSRNREAIAILAPPPIGFLPGLAVQASIVLGQRKDALLVKKDALIRQGNLWLLFKIVGDKAQRVEVQILNEDRGYVEVSGDIKPGDQVVTVGNESLFHNAPVSLEDPFSPKKLTYAN